MREKARLSDLIARLPLVREGELARNAIGADLALRGAGVRYSSLGRNKGEDGLRLMLLLADDSTKLVVLPGKPSADDSEFQAVVLDAVRRSVAQP